MNLCFFISNNFTWNLKGNEIGFLKLKLIALILCFLGHLEFEVIRNHW